jgi:3-deoxy-D-manno-octulosonate 8-phosphate phosphatase (KDO 8-P phosphatase)
MRKPPVADDAIRLLVLDVDGVLTDGRLYFGPRGEALKVFHARDGYGMRCLIAAGIEIAVISGRASPAVSARCRELEITRVFQGAADKLLAFERLLKATRLSARQCACIGDDVPDVPLFDVVGLSFAVPAAPAAVRHAAHHVTKLAGGMGAVREVCDRLVRAKRGGGRAKDHH